MKEESQRTPARPEHRTYVLGGSIGCSARGASYSTSAGPVSPKIFAIADENSAGLPNKITPPASVKQFNGISIMKNGGDR